MFNRKKTKESAPVMFLGAPVTVVTGRSAIKVWMQFITVAFFFAVVAQFFEAIDAHMLFRFFPILLWATLCFEMIDFNKHPLPSLAFYLLGIFPLSLLIDVFLPVE